MRRLSSFLVVLLLAGALTAAEPEPRWWSLRPLSKPKVPEVAGPDIQRVRNPIDAFILAKLREQKLTPTPAADARTLIRRLYFDLLGLPPTPEEIAAFVKDAEARPAAAYEALVDRLLASPHYGERWARHWLDVVHFAESHGHDQDRVRPNAWPYRDYLIKAFNSDRPYARFVCEQIAADVLFPSETERIAALGLLAAGPWDESSLRDIREDSIDRQVAYYLDRDDMVSNVISTFSGLTIHCARCHDHKFDPLTQDDYYGLQAVFAGVGRADRPFDIDPGVPNKRREIQARLLSLEKRETNLIAGLLEPAFQAEIRAWEPRSPRTIAWTVLDPQTMTSASGATLTKLTDRSILSGGARPEKDIYTIAATSDLKGITAVRLEVLTDDSLPKHGPGRQDNGNLHLSEFRIKAAPRADAPMQPLAIANATADFDQQGWTIRHAVDSVPGTAWGIYPEIGKPHQAIFELRESVGFESGAAFTFVLEQQHGGGHLIGRLRLSVTTARGPIKIGALPGPVAEALSVEADKRTRDQAIEVAAYYLKEKLTAELAGLPVPKMVYAVSNHFAADGSHKPPTKPRIVNVLKRGEIGKPLHEAAPGALACINEIPSRFDLANPDDEGARRAALANWLTDEKNPLTWRSIVNRVWHYHFGRGIVDTPNDFGKMGGLPTHPELLDYLASEFRDGGGSIKKLQRLIVTSATYRQTTRHDAANAKLDADNRYLWRMNRARLDAESTRDAILLISERLNRTGGGPSDQQFTMKPGLHVTPIVEYTPFNWDRPEGHRRSIYRFIFRTLPDPFVACLDGADASQLTPVRSTSISPLQALTLMNNEFVLVHARAFAQILEKANRDADRQIDLAVERVWGRLPTAEERADMKAYMQKHGLANLCRLLFNSNEFLFVN